MTETFYDKLKKRGGPVLALAPLANVTDVVFRGLIAKYGKPDVMYTEFVSCDGLVSQGRDKLLIDLQFSEDERPIVAQFFGSEPANFYKCALLAAELGFDGIDINMGCPDRAVEKQGGGAALIKNPELAQEIIAATKKGAGKLPVSVKTRLGYSKDILDEWLPELLAAEPEAITIHARTRKEMSLVDAHWDRVAAAVNIRNSLRSRTLIFGNGDAKDMPDAEFKAKQTGCEGVMIGRGIFGNPWLFSKTTDYRTITIEQKLSVMLDHTFLFEKTFQGVKSFETMKKHFKAYVAGWDGARELRAKLMAVHTAEEVREVVMQHFPKVAVPAII